MAGNNQTLNAVRSLRQRLQQDQGQSGSPMTLQKLRDICRENGAPTCPLACTRLDLNCQMFTEIGACIAEYRDVVQLHLERNKILRIANLEALAASLQVRYYGNEAII